MLQAVPLAALVASLAGIAVLLAATYSRIRVRAHARYGQPTWCAVLDRKAVRWMVDVAALVALVPLWALLTVQSHRSLREVALQATPHTFFSTVVLVTPLALSAVQAASRFCAGRLGKTYAPQLAAAAAVGVMSAATATSVGCEFSHPARAQTRSCAEAVAVKATVVVAQLLCAAAAIAFLVATNTRSKVRTTAQQGWRVTASQQSSNMLAPQTHDESYGPAVDLEYGGRIVRGILDQGGHDAGGTIATSLGYGSAIASSANPYQVSVRSDPAEQCTEDSNASAPTLWTHIHRPTDASSDFTPRGAGHKPPPTTPTSELIQAEGDILLRPQPWQQKESVQLVAVISLIAARVAMCIAALVVASHNAQTLLIAAAFCAPALAILVSKATHIYHPTLATIRRATYRERWFDASSVGGGGSRRTSTASMVVVEEVGSMRKRTHVRSYSCPLESERNGYTHLAPEAAGSKQRRSVSSTKSVPYRGEHWRAGKVSGDRVVAPRSSWLRALNLLVVPKPRLEVLPVRPPAPQRDTGAQRRATLSASATSAIVQGLLDARIGAPSASEHSVSRVDSHESFVTTLHISADASDGTTAQTAHASNEADPTHEGQGAGELDDSPGSARRWSEGAVDEQSDLRSPTKRRPLPIEATEATPSPSSFSRAEEPILSRSASRLFAEILHLVRGAEAPARHPEQRHSLGAGLKRTPPRGYASLDDAHHDDASHGTMIVHSDESSASWTAHRRTASASSTFSLASLSGRVRALGRAALGTESPERSSDAEEQGKVKKMRSRTFASAFGIELGVLARSGSKGRRESPRTHEASPSTSAGTCPSSLMGVSFSPSPLSRQGAQGLHRRETSQADSLLDGLDEPSAEALEETLEDDHREAERAAPDARNHWTSDAGEMDLAEVSVLDVWERFTLDAEDAGSGADDAVLEAHGEGYKAARVATAPFLDTVEEESEGELEPALSRAVLPSAGGRVDGTGTGLGWEVEARQMRVAQLLAEHEVLFPHKTLSQIDEVTEAATSPPPSEAASGRASRTDRSEVGEVRSPSALARHSLHLGLALSKRCLDEAHSSGHNSLRTDEYYDAESSHHAGSGEGVEESASLDDVEPLGLLPFVTPRTRMRRRVAEAHSQQLDPPPERCEAAETSERRSQVQPSPRCTSARLRELGMDAGIWQSSPVKLDLLARSASPAGRSASSSDASGRSNGVDKGKTTRLRRSMTLTKQRLGVASPKREVRNRLARASSIVASAAEAVEPEKRLLHRPFKKPRKSRLKGVAVMIARHEFTVVDEDDSLVGRLAPRPDGGAA